MKDKVSSPLILSYPLISSPILSYLFLSYLISSYLISSQSHLLSGRQRETGMQADACPGCPEYCWDGKNNTCEACRCLVTHQRKVVVDDEAVPAPLTPEVNLHSFNIANHAHVILSLGKDGRNEGAAGWDEGILFDVTHICNSHSFSAVDCALCRAFCFLCLSFVSLALPLRLSRSLFRSLSLSLRV